MILVSPPFVCRSLLPVICALAAAPLALSAAGHRAVSAPYGVVARDLSAGLQGAAFPLFDERFAGTVDLHDEGRLVVRAAPPALKNALVPGARYYVEVLTGRWTGERLDLDLDATLSAAGSGELALDLGDASHSTHRELPDGALEDARIAVREHLTLARLPAQFPDGLAGNDDPALAAAVGICSPSGLRFVTLAGDGNSWRHSDGTLAEAGQVLPPDESFLLRVVGDGARWRHVGVVRTNPFRKNLRPGLQGFASGFPFDFSPAGIGARVDPATPVAQRWTGHNVAAAADRLQVYVASEQAFAEYYLRGDGSSWWPRAGGGAAASQELIEGFGVTLLRRVKMDRTFAIPVPF